MKQEEFLRLPMMIDTQRKVRMRLKLEKDLAQLESDIAMLDRFKSMYVINEDCSDYSKIVVWIIGVIIF